MIRIVSGGQTGVDRAALDAAMALGVQVGGWCPLGRLAEDGVIPAGYPLDETPRAAYAERTHWNARDSDATLILTQSATLRGGTALTLALAEELARPVCVIELGDPSGVDGAAGWVRQHEVRVLNVAGPRESEAPGVYADARAWMTAFLSACLS